MKMSIPSSSTQSLTLPKMGLGMAALGRPGYINLNRDTILGDKDRTFDKMQSQANNVLDQLFQSCNNSNNNNKKNDNTMIPWIDCARSYGLSEMMVGEYLKKKKIKPNQVYVSSKWGYSALKKFKYQLRPPSCLYTRSQTIPSFVLFVSFLLCLYGYFSYILQLMLRIGRCN